VRDWVCWVEIQGSVRKRLIGFAELSKQRVRLRCIVEEHAERHGEPLGFALVSFVERSG
jgi:hypothetical protein